MKRTRLAYSDDMAAPDALCADTGNTYCMSYDTLTTIPDLVLRFLEPPDIGSWHRSFRWMAARWLDQHYVLLVMQTAMDEAMRLYQSIPSSTAFYRAAVADEVILGLRIARVLIDDGVRGHDNSILRLDCDSESINL